MNCNFIYNDDKQVWVCSRCGRTVAVPKDHHVIAVCKPGPSIVEKALNYTKAVIQHVATGSNTRTDEEVAERLAICQSCDKYNQEAQSCTICGCKCNANKSAFTNKLRMQSQVCPIGKWR